MPQIKEVNILDLARGAILEQIDREARLVMQNILDPNTGAEASRKLTVTLTFKPDENREIVSISAQAKASLAPIKAITTSIIVEADSEGQPRAAEITRKDPNQLAVFTEDEPATNVIKLARSV